MPKSRGRKPKKKRAPASAPKKRLDNFNTAPQELPLSTQPPQEPQPATAPRQQQPTQKIKKIAKLTMAVVLAAILLTLPYGGLQERSSLICATTVCTVCEHAQPKWAKNSSRITSAPAHEDSLRRRIVQWLSAYFLAPNSRSRRQSSIKPSSCFVPIPATPLRSLARSTRARFTSIMTRSSSPMARSCC